MIQANTYGVIMAGGIGSRFWPMSKRSYPKQFLDILGTGETLIQMTYERFLKTCPPENIYVVTNERYQSLVLEQLPGISKDQVLCEPSRRNTAPCIAYASYKIHGLNPDANIIVAPSDHLILKTDDYLSTIGKALEKASSGNHLITLGIKPSRPDTGYGYIQFIDEGEGEVKKVKTFTEKPNHELAKTFLESGDFFWNSGIFIFSANSIIDAFKQHLPEVGDLFVAGVDQYNTSEEGAFIADVYAVCKNISIDYGIMEAANNVFVVLSDFGWSDLGTWGSLYTHLDLDNDGNGIIGDEVRMYQSENCIVNVQKGKLAVLQGLEDYIVVDTPKTLLVVRKHDEQKIKEFVADLKSDQKDEFV